MRLFLIFLLFGVLHCSTSEEVGVGSGNTEEAVELYKSHLERNTQDLTNKIPCLDKSAKYRARPEKASS